MMPHEIVHKYIDKIWYLYLKATAFKHIHLAKQKQQLYAKILEEMSVYVNSQRPKSTTIVICHTIVFS